MFQKLIKNDMLELSNQITGGILKLNEVMKENKECNSLLNPTLEVELIEMGFAEALEEFKNETYNTFTRIFTKVIENENKKLINLKD